MSALHLALAVVLATFGAGCAAEASRAATTIPATAPASTAPTTAPVLRAAHRVQFDRPDGPYSREAFAADFGARGPVASRGFARIQDGALEVIFNPGVKVNDTGYSAHISVSPRKQYTLSFRVRFPDEFEPSLHGKQMGLSGGRGYDGGRGEQAALNGDGWSVRLQFDSRADRVTNTLYVYHADMAGKYGGPAGAKPFAMQRGRWYQLRMNVTMNSSVDLADGRIQVWCDDQPVIDVSTIRFARVETGRQIDRIRLEVFPGGAGEFPSRENYIAFDDIAWHDR